MCRVLAENSCSMTQGQANQNTQQDVEQALRAAEKSREQRAPGSWFEWFCSVARRQYFFTAGPSNLPLCSPAWLHCCRIRFLSLQETPCVATKRTQGHPDATDETPKKGTIPGFAAKILLQQAADRFDRSVQYGSTALAPSALPRSFAHSALRPVKAEASPNRAAGHRSRHLLSLLSQRAQHQKERWVCGIHLAHQPIHKVVSYSLIHGSASRSSVASLVALNSAMVGMGLLSRATVREISNKMPRMFKPCNADDTVLTGSLMLNVRL